MDVKIEGNSFYYKQFDYYDEEKDKVSIFVFEYVNPLEEMIREFFPYFVCSLILGVNYYEWNINIFYITEYY